MLTNRRIQILKAIVDEFIQTAEPVGSKTLMEKYNLPYYSATIRNDMQYLEEYGYLEKTHTSSGRIPSTEGYKFYCEYLLENKTNPKMEVALQKIYNNDALGIEDVIQASCDVLSEMTNLTTGVLGPDARKQRLEHVKLFPVSDRSAVCVFITDTGHTETKNFKFDQEISVDDIQNCCNILNDRLKGTYIENLADKMESIRPVLAAHVVRHDLLFKAFVQAFAKFANDNIYFSGQSKMLYQPEFSDIEKLRNFMNMLDNSSIWRTLTGENNTRLMLPNEGFDITWVDDVAVVKQSFRINDDEQGQLMIVGPARMDYEKIVSMLDSTTKMIEHIYGGNNGRK